MSLIDLLSDELYICIDSHDSSLRKTFQNKQEDKQTHVAIRKMLKLAVSSLEGFSDDLAAQLVSSFKEDPDYWDWIVDDHYSREAVGNIRGIVDRFSKLSHVPAGVIPSAEVTRYLREATRCYVYGFAQASIALSRAALEAGLNDYLRRKVKAAGELKLMEKVKWAERCKLIDRSCSALAEDVSKAAGMVPSLEPVEFFWRSTRTEPY